MKWLFSLLLVVVRVGADDQTGAEKAEQCRSSFKVWGDCGTDGKDCKCLGCDAGQGRVAGEEVNGEEAKCECDFTKGYTENDRKTCQYAYRSSCYGANADRWYYREPKSSKKYD